MGLYTTADGKSTIWSRHQTYSDSCDCVDCMIREDKCLLDKYNDENGNKLMGKCPCSKCKLKEVK